MFHFTFNILAISLKQLYLSKLSILFLVQDIFLVYGLEVLAYHIKCGQNAMISSI